MIRRLSRWLAPLVVALVLAPSAAFADTEAGPEHAPPILAGAIALFGTLLALVVVCMPSRKT